jgi:DNA-binding MarR family transcriptional regulator
MGNKITHTITASIARRRSGGAEKDETNLKARNASSQKPKRQESQAASYGSPATTSLPALLHRQSDQQFRRLIQDLLTVSRRLELARDYFGRCISVTGPQYSLLMTVAQLQGRTGVSVGSVAKAMRVSSAFITSEIGKLSDAGLITKRPNPEDGRSALLSLAPAGRMRIDGLMSEIRTVNDLFFGLLDARSFAQLCASAGALVRGSREAMQYIERIEEVSDKTL